MKSVGQQLQEARLARNWTPELAARETKIKVDRVRDLEADDYTHFSSPTYARGFVRTYARALGLDEYKVLRQLDNKLPEDDTPSFVPDTGIPYVPEASKSAHAVDRNSTGLYVVMGLGCTVLLVIAFVLFQAYRAGEFSRDFAGGSGSDITNAAPAAEAEAAPRALPVNPVDISHSPRALPVDLNGLSSGSAPANGSTPPAVAAPPPAEADAPIHAVRALPVDPSELTNASPVAASPTPSPVPAAAEPAPVAADPAPPAASVAAAPTPTPTPGVNAPIQAVRALPVDPSELAAASAPPVASPAPASTPPPSPVVQPAASAPVTIVAANTPPPQRQPAVVPTDAPSPASPATTQMVMNDAGQPVAVNSPGSGSAPVLNDAGHVVSLTPTPEAVAPATAEAPVGDKRLVLTASRDSFVRVMAVDAADNEQVLYASVLHTGQSIAFGGRKFSLNVGIPAAVDINLDGVNYGPHSEGDSPETFTIESHLP